MWTCSEVGYEEKTVNLIRRIDFAWAVERDTKKPKKAKEASGPSAWQGLIENLHLAHQELSVIIDLINTVCCFQTNSLSFLIVSHFTC